jgi:Fic family protein
MPDNKESLQLTLRQKALLITIEQQERGITRARLEDALATGFEVSRVTIIRDLNTLLAYGLIETEGRGAATSYRARSAGELLRYFDMAAYYSYPPDERTLTDQSVQGLLSDLDKHQLLSAEEKQQIDLANSTFKQRLQSRDEDILKREQERFTIELAWKSSQIEGNTYSLLETEELIKTSREAAGHAASEAQMILNHKAALEYIQRNLEDFRQITLDGILAIHALLAKGLDISTGIRRQPVGITGTAYLPPDNQEDIQRYLQETISVVCRKDHPVEAAIIISAIIAYLQPFVDGNKRCARLTANALLLANGYAALSYRSVGELAYKQAVLLIDEQHSLYWYKRLFIEQFTFACEKYFV